MEQHVSWIEKVASRLGLVPRPNPSPSPPRLEDGTLSQYPPFERWLKWEELDASKTARRYALVPTTCFNCEAGCGLLAYIDLDEGSVRKIEGNPLHPGSRGKNCAKGPATLNQTQDPERILTPMRRNGERGRNSFEPCSWDEALDAIASRVRAALLEERRDEVMYHVGRPGHEGFVERVLQAWGVDGHNSHTTVCSASARCGYQLTWGHDRPSPDFENAQLILLVSAHLESGHYFNPHAQRITEARKRGARLVVLDPRLSNTAAKADLWLPTRPGSEGTVLLAVIAILLRRGQIDRGFIEEWVDWRGYLQELHPHDPPEVGVFLKRFGEHLESYTAEVAAEEAGIDSAGIEALADEVARAGNRLAAHIWRAAASGNVGGWQIARAMALLTAFTGAVGCQGGTSPAAWNKFKPATFSTPEAQECWNELIWPREYPLSFYEMSHLLPHLVGEGGRKIDVYFTRVFNPVWTFPDGLSWMEMLKDENKIGLHVALTPTWNETAFFADYVLPMGHSTERHDVQSQETHSARWLSFRQPVMRALARFKGEETTDTRTFNPGEVWEEDEFWIELTWRIDPDGTLGARRHFESPYRPGEKVTVEEYYSWIFENAVPGLPGRAREKEMSPFEYMSRVGAFELETGRYRQHLERVEVEEGSRMRVDAASGLATIDGEVVGVAVDGAIRKGFPTPSRRIEVYSKTLEEWGFEEEALPRSSPSHVAAGELDPERGIHVLVPTFRLPTMIHSRSGNAKHLAEISHSNPLWVHPDDAQRQGIGDGDLARVETKIGHFVNRVRVTEGVRPGVLACSHHMGRWRLQGGPGSRWNSSTVRFDELDGDRVRMRIIEGTEPFSSDDPDSSRIWWKESGVHQNLAFGVQSDPVSGMHCWHQVVRLRKAEAGDRYGDVLVDREKSRSQHAKWLEKAKPARADLHDGLRRPLWLSRPMRPTDDAYRL